MGRRLAVALWLALAAAAQTQVAVIAHRGEHLHHPENTIPAFRAAVEMGADFIEVDVRTTKDGKLVLMHDGNVDRTTNGHGKIAEMSFAEIRALDSHGARVPTLDEAMDLVEPSSTGVYLDCKQVAPQALVDAIERHHLSARVVMYGGRAFLQQVLALRPALKAMPEANNATILKSLVEDLHLRVAAFGSHDFNDETIAAAKAAKVDIYVDRQGDNTDNPAVWQDAVDRGATGIQTDRPAELLAYLRRKGYHK